MTGCFQVSEYRQFENRHMSYLLGIVSCIILPVRPVMYIRGLLSTLKNVFVGGLVDLLDFVTTEDDRLDCPVVVLDIVHLCCNGCDDAEVVASPLHTPPEV